MEQRNFLIFALPRSRTAWLSNLFCTGPIFCHHDGLRYSQAPPALSGFMDDTGGQYTHVGNCDNGMAMFAEDVLNEYPDARVAVIQRDPEECLRSLEVYLEGVELPQGAMERVVHQTQLGLDVIKASGRCDLTLPFDGLHEMNALYSLWAAMIGGGRAFDRKRTKALQGFHVELHRDVYVPTMTDQWLATAHANMEN